MSCICHTPLGSTSDYQQSITKQTVLLKKPETNGSLSKQQCQAVHETPNKYGKSHHRATGWGRKTWEAFLSPSLPLPRALTNHSSERESGEGGECRSQCVRERQWERARQRHSLSKALCKRERWNEEGPIRRDKAPEAARKRKQWRPVTTEARTREDWLSNTENWRQDLGKYHKQREGWRNRLKLCVYLDVSGRSSHSS